MYFIFTVPGFPRYYFTSPSLQIWEDVCGKSLQSIFGQTSMVKSLIDNDLLILDDRLVFSLYAYLVGTQE